jgi:hypothetical protein
MNSVYKGTLRMLPFWMICIRNYEDNLGLVRLNNLSLMAMGITVWSMSRMIKELQGNGMTWMLDRKWT